MKTFKKSFIKKKPLGKASSKAQSAMEYLMTYGWAILIVAVVLGALYSLGVFNGAAFLGTSCIAASGFYCTNPILSTGGVLTVTIGQATGTTFVPSGINFSTSDPSTSIGTLNSGQQVTVSIPLGVGSPYPAAYTLGTPLSGYLYLQFTDIYGTTEVNKIATVLTKVIASSSGATFSQPTSIPSGIVAYVPITITNSQSSATPSPFQQMIQINEGNYANYIAYNGNIANFEFFTQSGSVLPAWIESNNSGTLTVWINLPNGIPVSSSLTIYLGFASKTTNLLSNSGTSGIGEAPQLSSTYAEYDDGASVFNNYWNFAGTTMPSGWNTAETANLIVNNGVSFTGASTGGNAAQIVYTTTIPRPLVIEYYAYSSGTNPIASVAYVNIYGSPFASGYSTYFADFGGNCSNKTQETIRSWTSGSFTAQASNNDCPPATSYNIWTLSLGPTGGPISAIINYGSTPAPVTWTDSLNYNNYYVALSSWWNDKTIHIQYARVRAYPPNGVMPSVTFGGLSAA